MNTKHIILFIIIMVLGLVSVLLTNSQEPQYTVNGTSVYYENQYGRADFYKDSNDGCFIGEIRSKVATQDIDCAITSNSGKAVGKSADVFVNMSHSGFELNYTTVSVPYPCNNNQSTCYNIENITQRLSKTIWYPDWNNINHLFSKQTYNNKDYYTISNINWNNNETKKVRLCMNSPMQRLPNGKWGVDDKFDIICKRSSNTWSNAISSGLTFGVDPWQNTSCDNRVSTLVSPTQTDANQLLEINLTRDINFNYAYVYENISNGILPFFNITTNTFVTNLSVTAGTKVGIDIYYNCSALSPRYNISQIALEGWDFETQAEVETIGSILNQWTTNRFVNTTLYKFGRGSIQDAATTSNHVLREGIPSEEKTNRTLVYYWYDDGANVNDNAVEFFNTTGGDFGYRIGVYIDASSTNYSVQNQSGQKTQTPILRTTGWHRIQTDVNRSGGITYIDGVYTKYNPVLQAFFGIGLVSTGSRGPYDIIYLYNNYGADNPTLNVGTEESNADTTSPISILSEPVNNTITASNTVKFVCNATDETGLSNISLYLGINSLTLNVTNSTSGTSNGTIFQVSKIPDGNYIWNCLATDTSNNQAFNTSYNRTLEVDTMVPSQITLLNPTSQQRFTGQNSSAIFNITANDGVDTNLTCNITLDGIQNNKTLGVRANGGNINSSSINITGISRGTHQWNTTCYDNANNSNVSATFNFTFNSAPNAPNITFPFNNSITANSSITWTAADNDSDLLTYKVYVSNGSSFNPINYSNLTLTALQDTPNLLDGNWHILVQSNDSFENSPNSTELNFTLDTTKPYINLTYPANNAEILEGNFNLTYYVNDTSTISSCTLDFTQESNRTDTSVSVNVQDQSFAFNKGAGTYNWRVYCTDASGNVNVSETRTLTLSVDQQSGVLAGQQGGGVSIGQPIYLQLNKMVADVPLFWDYNITSIIIKVYDTNNNLIQPNALELTFKPNDFIVISKTLGNLGSEVKIKPLTKAKGNYELNITAFSGTNQISKTYSFTIGEEKTNLGELKDTAINIKEGIKETTGDIVKFFKLEWTDRQRLIFYVTAGIGTILIIMALIFARGLKDFGRNMGKGK